LTFERRVELLNWATRVGAYVVEDDYDSDSIRWTSADSRGGPG